MHKKEIVTYYSLARQRMSALQTYKVMAKNIYQTRWFIWVLFARDYFMANKRSFLGYGWLFLSPLFSALSWIALNLLGVLNTGVSAVPFPVFVLIGTSFWVLFNNIYGNFVGIFGSVGGMLGAVNFPHESLMGVQLMKALANFLISSLLNVGILLLFGIYPNLYWLALPLMIIPLMMMAMSFGLFAMILSYALPDFKKAIDFIFPLLMYITPIVFMPTEKSEQFFFLIRYNPLTYLIGVLRDIVLFGQSDYWFGFMITTGVSVVVFLIALRIFYIAEEYLIEKMY